MPPRDPAAELLAACRDALSASAARPDMLAALEPPQDFDISALWARLPDWFAYSDPARSVEIAAFGSATPEAEWRAGREPFAASDTAVVVQTTSNDCRVDPIAPRWVGALPFRTGRGAVTMPGPFAQSDLGALHRPRVVLWRRGDARGAWVATDPETRTWLDRVAPLPQARFPEPALGPATSDEPEDLFVSRVGQARDAIVRGAFVKVVVARSARIRAPEGLVFDARCTLHALRAAHPRAVVFGVALAGGAAFVGATPELLVRTDGRYVETQALAGTAAVTTAGGVSDLERSQKDRGEQAVVASVITAALAPLCETLTVSAPTVLSASHLEHLTSSVRGELRAPTHVLELAGRLHPTPAVGGAPRDEAERWLLETEPLDRGLYAGPVGFVDGVGGGQFNVAIRSAHLSAHEATAFAGAGVVRDSDPASEWRETELKLSVVRAGLRVALP